MHKHWMIAAALLLGMSATARAVTTYSRCGLQAPDVGDATSSYPTTIKNSMSALDASGPCVLRTKCFTVEWPDGRANKVVGCPCR